MKILFLATYFPRPANRRIGPWALDQAQAFARLGAHVQVESLHPIFPPGLPYLLPKVRAYASAPKQWDLSPITVHYPRWPYIAASVFENKLHGLRWRYMAWAWKFARKKVLPRITSWDPDLIYAHHTLVNGWVACQLKQETGIPFVTTDHEIGDIINCDTNATQRRVFQNIVSRASATVAISQSMEKDLNQRFPEANTVTIYNGGGFEDFTEKVLEKPSQKDGTTRVFCCANFYPRKDIPLLIECFDRVAGKFPQLELRIGGSGPDQPKIDEVYQCSDNKSAIHLLGALDKEQVKEEMAAADLFALIGWAEPFGIVFLEAMSAGCALLVSEDAGVAEILDHGKTAWLTKPRNPESITAGLDHLLSNPEQMKSLGRNAFQQYKGHLGWSNAAEKYLELFDRVIERKESANG